MRGKDFRISLPKAYSIEKVQIVFFQTVYNARPEWKFNHCLKFLYKSYTELTINMLTKLHNASGIDMFGNSI